MSENAPTEALRAFAQSKPTEFDSFLASWLKQNPQVKPPTITVEQVNEAEETNVNEGDIYYIAPPSVESQIEAIRPKSRRKRSE